MKDIQSSSIIVNSPDENNIGEDSPKMNNEDANQYQNQSHKRCRICFPFLLMIALILLIFQAYLIQQQRGEKAVLQDKNEALLVENQAYIQKIKNLKQNARAKSSQKIIQPKITQAPPRSYVTQQLQAISTIRKQLPGRIQTPQGTVSELKQLMKNELDEGIEEVLYSSQDMRNYRRLFIQQRNEMLKKNRNFESLNLCKYTLKWNDGLTKEEEAEDIKEYSRIDKIHSLSHYHSEIPMCIIVPTYNNNAHFRVQLNLNSIFVQNYTNYFAVIINDVSTDGTDQIVRKYIDFYNITPQRYVYIDNKERLTALENIYNAVMNHCSEDSIVLNLDGDDEFIGKNVLKIFNANYQKTNAGVIYSNYLRVKASDKIELGLTKYYPESVKRSRNFRTSPQYFSHLRSHRADLFRAIPLQQLQDDEGKFFRITYDMAMYYPLMQLACGHVAKIPGFHYLYNFNTGLNDFTVNRQYQREIEKRVRGGKILACDPKFALIAKP